MGRYDGEDYSDSYYQARALERSRDRIEVLEEFVRQFAPAGLRQLLRLHRPTEHYFTEEEVLAALKGLKSPRRVLAEWEEKHYVWTTTWKSLSYGKPDEERYYLSPYGQALVSAFASEEKKGRKAA